MERVDDDGTNTGPWQVASGENGEQTRRFSSENIGAIR
jgi:hypothetical protein